MEQNAFNDLYNLILEVELRDALVGRALMGLLRAHGEANGVDLEPADHEGADIAARITQTAEGPVDDNPAAETGGTAPITEDNAPTVVDAPEAPATEEGNTSYAN